VGAERLREVKRERETERKGEEREKERGREGKEKSWVATYSSSFFHRHYKN